MKSSTFFICVKYGVLLSMDDTKYPSMRSVILLGKCFPVSLLSIVDVGEGDGKVGIVLVDFTLRMMLLWVNRFAWFNIRCLVQVPWSHF